MHPIIEKIQAVEATIATLEAAPKRTMSNRLEVARLSVYLGGLYDAAELMCKPLMAGDLNRLRRMITDWQAS